MTQRRIDQYGLFHVTTNAQKKVPWCTAPGVSEMLIDNLRMTSAQHGASILAFCVLPDHMHVIVSPGEKGLSSFVHSFKRNSSKDVRYFLEKDGSRGRRTAAASREKASCSAGSVTCAAAMEGIDFLGWQRGFHDELIRDDKQKEHAIIYVQENAVKHGFVENAKDWPWTSLHFPEMIETTLSM